MSYAVSNGAVGKSPLIDKLNQFPIEQVKNTSSKQMEQLICKPGTIKYQAVSISFDKCQKEMKKQLER